MAEKDVESLRNFLQRFHLGEDSGAEEEKPKPEQLLKELTLQGIADYIKEGKCKRVIVMSGAGISTSAGIPDFRSPGTGLYDNLQKYNLPNPQAIFEIGFFRENPEPFFTLSKELFPGAYFPTPSHFFIRLLHEKGILLRHYTQNIDTLDRIAGVPDEMIMEAHGSFHTGHCLSCNDEFTEESMREKIMADLIPKCEKCDDGVVKPDVVFFGESLPPRFPVLVSEDFPQCDLLIVMGTSLVVQPFASLIDKVPETTPRLLINMEKTGKADPMMMMFGFSSGMDFDSDDKYRDVACIGPCDEGCQRLAELVGWKKEFAALVKEGEAKKKQQSRTKKEKESASPAKDRTARTTLATKDQKPKTTTSPKKKSPASPTNDQKPKTATSPKKKSLASPTNDQKPKTAASPKKKSPSSPTKDQKLPKSTSPTKKTPVSPAKDKKPNSKKD